MFFVNILIEYIYLTARLINKTLYFNYSCFVTAHTQAIPKDIIIKTEIKSRLDANFKETDHIQKESTNINDQDTKPKDLDFKNGLSDDITQSDVKQNRINTRLDINQIKHIRKIISKSNATERKEKQASNIGKITTLKAVVQSDEIENKYNIFYMYKNQADLNRKIKTPLSPKANKKKIQPNYLDVYKEQADNISRVTTVTSKRNATENKLNNFYMYRNQADFIKKIDTPLVIAKGNTEELYNLYDDGRQDKNDEEISTFTMENITYNKHKNLSVDKRQDDDIKKFTIIKTNVTEIEENNIENKEKQTQTKNFYASDDAQVILGQTSIFNLTNDTQIFGEHLKFTDFVQNLIEVIKTFQDRELRNLVNTFNNEIRRCNHDNCAFDELFSNFENRNYITHTIKNLQNIPAAELRQKLTEFQKEIESERLKSSTKYVIDYINNITYKNSQNKLTTVLNNFKALSRETNRTPSDFENLLREEMRIILFDHYAGLDRKVQLGLGKLLNEYVRPIEQSQGRSFKRWHPENNINYYEKDYVDDSDLIGSHKLLKHKIVKRQVVVHNQTARLNKLTNKNVAANKRKVLNNVGHKQRPSTEVAQHLTIASPEAYLNRTALRKRKRRKYKKRRNRNKQRGRQRGKKKSVKRYDLRVGRTGKKIENSNFG